LDTRTTHLELFAGAGGGIYAGILLGWRTVCAVERDEYCQRVLAKRQADGIFDSFPVWDDCETFDGRPWRGVVDIVSAGFPCQPFSNAGTGTGAEDKKNGWPHAARIIRETAPILVFLENVPGLVTTGYFGTVLGDLADAGYNAEWMVLGADDCGAPHRRKRLWILAWSANANCQWWTEQAVSREEVRIWARNVGEAEPFGARRSPWAAEPKMGRMAHGVANRSKQLKTIGNGQVPIVAARAFRVLADRAMTEWEDA